MNTETNRFEELPPEEIEGDKKYIPFEIGEYFVLKGYKFRVSEVNVSQNRLILLPIGMAYVRNPKG